MFLVGLQVLHPALLDELDHPARVEIDAEADAAAMMGQVLDRQTQPPRAGRAEHQPVRRPSGRYLSGSVSLNIS